MRPKTLSNSLIIFIFNVDGRSDFINCQVNEMPEGKSKSLLAFVLKDCTHSLLLSMGSVESESWFLISLILFLNLWSALCEDLIEFKLKFSLFLYLVVAQRYLNESGSIFNSLKVCIVYEFPSDFDILIPSESKWAPCTHMPTTFPPVYASLWAISPS